MNDALIKMKRKMIKTVENVNYMHNNNDNNNNHRHPMK